MTKINAQIGADSLSPQGDRLISILCTFPHIILAEVNTHRMLSKNTSSSRAIPFKKVVQTIQENPFIPIAWQKHHSGMQGTEYYDEKTAGLLKRNWLSAKNEAVVKAVELYEEGLTKQLCNRLLEPFMWTTMLITGSKEGWDNFFELRCPVYEFDDKSFKSIKEVCNYIGNCEFVKMDGATAILTSHNTTYQTTNKGQAEIHMMALAEAIYDAVNESTPKQLKSNEWHIPFRDKIDYGLVGDISHNRNDEKSIENLMVKISTAIAARTSYTIVGNEKEIDYRKMIELHDKLIEMKHSSPFEHCARAMSDTEYNQYTKTYPPTNPSDDVYNFNTDNKVNVIFDKGWCRNYKGFIMYRHIVESKK